MHYASEPAPSADAGSCVAILLVNLGTPAEPTAPALRRYLRQFLSDPRVVEIPRIVWWPLLHGIILNTRPAKSAEKYRRIWTRDGSPLKVHTEKQAKLLRGSLGELGRRDLSVAWAMRYGEPSVASVLDRLKANGAEKILIVPLYPQYAASTTASSFDAVTAWLARQRVIPELRWVREYFDRPGYIAALAQSVRDYWQTNGRPEADSPLLMSFHGLPQRSVDLGDPYFHQCRETGRRLAEALALPNDRYRVVFQSRFGRAAWLQPYTQATLETLARQGTRTVDILCPGFAGDCLETLEEIALEGKAAFLAAGGRELRYIPCLNERADWIAALCDLVLDHLAGWPGSDERSRGDIGPKGLPNR